jgi:hypothetical protein
MKAQPIFLNAFYRLLTVQMEVVVCPFVGEETNRSYLFANGPKKMDLPIYGFKGHNALTTD